VLKRVVSLYHNHLETPAGHQKPKAMSTITTTQTQKNNRFYEVLSPMIADALVGIASTPLEFNIYITAMTCHVDIDGTRCLIQIRPATKTSPYACEVRLSELHKSRNCKVSKQPLIISLSNETMELELTDNSIFDSNLIKGILKRFIRNIELPVRDKK